MIKNELWQVPKKIDELNSQLENTLRQNISMIPNTLAKLDRGENTTIMFIGDSVTYGYWATNIDDTCYVAEFCNLLKAKYPYATIIRVDGKTIDNSEDTNITIWNSTTVKTGTSGQIITVVKSGVGGDTLLRLYRRANDFLAYNNKTPDLSVIMVGINDSLSDEKKHISVGEYERGYKALIQFIKRKTKSEVVMSGSHWSLVTGNDGTPNVTTTIDEYLYIAQKVANSEKIQYIDNYSMFKSQWIFGDYSWLYTDKLHPSDLGHQKIAENIYNNLFIYNQNIVPFAKSNLVYVSYNDLRINYDNTWQEHYVNQYNENVTFYSKASTIDSSLSCVVKGSKIYALIRRTKDTSNFSLSIDNGEYKDIWIPPTIYPTDRSDVKDISICGFQDEQILLADNLQDIEHIIRIKAKALMFFCGFEVGTQDYNYYSNKNDEGIESIVGTGQVVETKEVIYNKSFLSIPKVFANSSSTDYGVSITDVTINGFTIKVFPYKVDKVYNGATVGVTWKAFI